MRNYFGYLKAFISKLVLDLVRIVTAGVPQFVRFGINVIEGGHGHCGLLVLKEMKLVITDQMLVVSMSLIARESRHTKGNLLTL